MHLTLKIRTKLLLAFLTSSFVPIFIFAFIWFGLSYLGKISPIFILAIFLLISILLFSISLALSIWFSRQISRPIEKMQNWSKYIGLGLFDYRVDVQSGDEIEELAHSFNLMVSSLKQAFQNLEKDKDLISAERNKLKVIISAVNNPIIALDLNRTIITFNPAAQLLSGIPENEAIGKKISSILRISSRDGEVEEKVYAPIRMDDFEGVIYQGRDLKLKTEHKSADIHIVAAKIKESKQVNLGCILTLRDITQEKELDRMKLDFVSMAAHELRTPLTAIKGYLSLAISEFGPALDQKLNEYLTKVNISTDRLRALVENLLNISGIEKGTITLNKHPLNWTEEVRMIVDYIRTQAAQKNIRLEYEHDYDQVVLEVDKQKADDILINLLENAVFYSPSNSTVKIRFFKKDNFLITQIEDNGPGIPPESVPHLFTKFFRLTKNLEMGSKGVGLGLYMSKFLVNLHGGEIWVNSRVGNGSTFSFSLPLNQRNAPS